MKSDAIAFGVAGVLFGLIAGWIIGTQQARNTAVPAPQAAAPAPTSGSATAPAVDENRATALKSIAEREAANAAPRVQLGNLYFDAERYDEAIQWYSDALKLSPRDVNVSTDLGVSYYYTNQADKALAQFATSLAIDAAHTKTLLNLGVVKAFGKQDLEGAQAAWEQVIKLAPESQEGQQAKLALERLKAAHPGPASGAAAAPGT